MPINAENGTHSSPPIAVILAAIFLMFFIAGLLSIFFCRCFMEILINSWHLRRNHIGLLGNAHSGPGLHPSIIATFPTFVYSTVKCLRKKEDQDMECAICLSEFADDDTLRHLSYCCHVFHQECVDLWLKAHTTCPVCRKSLNEDTSDSSVECAMLGNNNSNYHSSRRDETTENSMEVDSISIAIKDDESKDNTIGNNVEERFRKSHSTGHSIVSIRVNEDEDRYTLRLPHDVHARITRGHHYTKSCNVFGDYSCGSTISGEARNTY